MFAKQRLTFTDKQKYARIFIHKNHSTSQRIPIYHLYYTVTDKIQGFTESQNHWSWIMQSNHPPTIQSCPLTTSLSATSPCFLNTPKHGYLTTLSKKKLLLTPKLNLPWCNLRPFPLVLLMRWPQHLLPQLGYSQEHPVALGSLCKLCAP